MKITAFNRNSAEVHLTNHELTILNNALNEVCHGIEVPEFATRIGATPAEAKHLLNAIRGLLDEMESARFGEE